MADTEHYGSLGALAPAWDEGERNIDTDEIYERFFGWVADVKGVEPWPHQEEAIMDLLAGDHVILNTPTGSGKSLVALGMHFAALCTGRRSYYTAPIKALVSEKFFDLVEVFGRDNVGMITGDTHINADAPIICCTAEILANQALREGRRADIGCVAMDEFHYYGDSERGWAWQVPLLTLPDTQFLLMSATLGNVDAIADKLEDMTDTDVDVIADAPRPVPLTYEYTLDPLEKTVELAFRKGEMPIYVVHFSQDAALDTAQSLASTGVSSKEQRQAIAEAIKGVKFTTAFGKILQRLLRTGVGIHHAGMLPRYRRLVEQLAQQGLLPVICGTDTLGVGINVPIHSVVLTALTKFDGTKMRRLRAREFHQIAGRAGRMGFDTEGLVVAEAPEYEIENAKAVAKAGNDPKKLKKVKRKKAPEGFVTWNQSTFDKLIDAAPETLVPHMKITHSMVLNEVTQDKMKKFIQTSVYLPYFLSWVLLGSIFLSMLQLDGVVNYVIELFGGEPVMFMASNKWAPVIMVVTDVWKNFGYGSIIYLAALTNVDTNLYEAAALDGASRIQQVRHVSVLLILKVGGLTNGGFDQIFNMYNELIYESVDIIDTFVYRIGLVELNFSLSTAVGLLKSVVSFVLIALSYWLAKKWTGYKIF